MRDVLGDERGEVFLSVASLWEMAIKYHLGRLELGGPLESWLGQAIRDANIETLDIASRHVYATDRLPDHHQDPFDRLLIAQAGREHMILVTHDKQILRYDVQTLST
ncbi:MAG: type II toxin-antitoxin system VapC family toxin [Myxococcota bacterium]